MRFSSRRTLHGAITALMAVAAAMPAKASDYMNVCRSADGLYEIDDGTLRRTDANYDSPPIPFRTLNETTLSRETGYCLSNKAKGQRFTYESRTWTQRVSFRDGGQSYEMNFICELAADGMPAAYSCDKQVVTSQQKAGAGGAAGQFGTAGESHWLHNGSIMRLEADGNARRFYYVAPRAGMRRVGASNGTLLFDGVRNGETYTGTAYIFAAGCAPQPYPVAGTVSAGNNRVVMVGRAPRIGKRCDVTGYRDDTLVFTYQSRGD